MEKLFSYGTLQIEQVQLDTFGRLLKGRKDVLRKYRMENLKITDPAVIKSSGTDIHPILQYTGNERNFVEGTIFEITGDELLKADRYEVADYKRRKLLFESGTEAWVYLKR